MTLPIHSHSQETNNHNYPEKASSFAKKSALVGSAALGISAITIAALNALGVKNLFIAMTVVIPAAIATIGLVGAVMGSLTFASFCVANVVLNSQKTRPA